MDWNKPQNEDVIDKTSKALNGRGIEVIVVKNGEGARKKVIELIPKGAEVMEASSTTLEQTGITKEINESGRYRSLKKEIMSVAQKDMRDAFRRRSTSPDYSIGSVQAVTQDGQIVVASGSGSQLAPYVYGAANLVLVVGTNKIVKDLDHAFKRIYEHALPLESERVKKAYGMPGSNVNKILIIEKDQPNRIKLIFVKEALGF